MKTTYPYYTLCKVDGGTLTKLSGKQKYDTQEKCIDALQRLKAYKICDYIIKAYQLAVVEYTAPYECKITHIHNTDGNIIKIQ